MVNLKFDPYRGLFPIGIFLGVWGVGSWLLYGFNIMSTYPGSYHASIMTGGFLFSMAVGFLMTAIPAFTETGSATPLELAVALVLGLGLATAGVIDRPAVFHWLVLAQMISLVLFGVRRVVSRKDNPPPTFVFVGLGIACGILGDIIFCLEDSGLLLGKWVLLGHNLFFQGMMLSLVLGVGSRLLPALMGWEELPIVQTSSSQPKEIPKTLNCQMAGLVALMICLLSSFVLEAFWSLPLGRLLRALVVTVIALRFWKLHKWPLEKTWLSRWLWISGWCVVIGLWGNGIFIVYGIHLLHITFIGGFSLMTLMIATRVTLAHGDHGYDLEGSSKGLKWAGILILAAMVTRALAPFTVSAYRTHLGYASLLWTVAIILWGWVFSGKIFVLKN